MSMKDEITTQKIAETTKSEKRTKLDEAINLVNEAIREKWEEYDKIAHTDEGDPVMLEGETSKGVIVHALVDPKEIARIFLEYNYPTIRILGEDAPQGMWDDLADLVGIESCYSVDL